VQRCRQTLALSKDSKSRCGGRTIPSKTQLGEPPNRNSNRIRRRSDNDRQFASLERPLRKHSPWHIDRRCACAKRIPITYANGAWTNCMSPRINSLQPFGSGCVKGQKFLGPPSSSRNGAPSDKAQSGCGIEICRRPGVIPRLKNIPSSPFRLQQADRKHNEDCRQTDCQRKFWDRIGCRVIYKSDFASALVFVSFLARDLDGG
jgi:hypothetical protein